MSKNSARFDTSVRSCWGVWPSRPAIWSYSSLKDMETCPRRWMLSRADYPDLWTGHGYPPAPAMAALFGDVVHATLEAVVAALVAAGCPSTGDAQAVGVLRGLGGFTAVVEQALAARLSRLVGNPRLSAARSQAYRRTLTDKLPDARLRVQTILSGTELPPMAQTALTGPRHNDGGPRPSSRPAVGLGAHPEVELIAENLRLRGRVDLLTVGPDNIQITDYKTGDDDPSHLSQMLTYALLWDLDHQANPTRRAATELSIEYPAHRVSIPAPAANQLRVNEAEIAGRIAAADAEVAKPLPEARPGPETCRFCQVRQLCDDYWQQVVPDPSAVRVDDWIDFEGVLTAPVGNLGWSVSRHPGAGPDVLLRMIAPEGELRVGDRIRALSVRRDQHPDSGAVEVAMSVHSEIFVLSRS